MDIYRQAKFSHDPSRGYPVLTVTQTLTLSLALTLTLTLCLCVSEK